MGTEIMNAEFEGKKEFVLPDGAVITKKSHTISVREIENGFILKKSYDIKYMINDESHYDYFSKEWYSEKNPLVINLPKDSKKSLADKLD